MTTEGSAPRRRFLQAAGLGLPALWLQLKHAQQAFADELEEVVQTTAEPVSGGFSDLRRQYSLAPDLTYLNHASIGTIPRPVQSAHRRYLDLCESNPWLHMWGDVWKEPLSEVRAKAADLLGCETEEVTFSHNTTETFNLLAHGLPLGPGDEVLFSTLNHSGASVCWSHMAETRGFSVRRFAFPVLETPGMTPEDVVTCYAQAIRPETRVLVLPHIDNVVGLRHPIRDIARKARKLGVEVVAVDAAQSVGMLPFDVRALEVDVLATSAHKWLQAPKGLGLAYINRRLHENLRPMSVTWGQKLWHDTARAYEDYGTRNLAEVLTLGDAMDFQRSLGPDRSEAHHRRLWTHARDRVDADPKLTWHSPREWSRGAALFSIGVQGAPSSEVFERLFATRGFIFRPFEVHGLNAVRLSPNALNTVAELDKVIDALTSCS